VFGDVSSPFMRKESASSTDPSWNDLPSYGAPYVPLLHLLVRHAMAQPLLREILEVAP